MNNTEAIVKSSYNNGSLAGEIVYIHEDKTPMMRHNAGMLVVSKQAYAKLSQTFCIDPEHLSY
jgi:hypothetical protein